VPVHEEAARPARPGRRGLDQDQLLQDRTGTRALPAPAQEGPCECDLYLTWAKFVTTPQYAPRLRERLKVERQLASDAEERGWDREIDRHQGIADRIICLLGELGEPRGMPGDET
jgi:hypothetical protein